MLNSEYDTLKAAIESNWPHPAGDKAKPYIGKFFNTTRLGTRISGQVEGNHGTYTVTLQVVEGGVSSACSCYIGKGGYCHHCHALGLTFIQNPERFVELKTRPLEAVDTPDTMLEYLRGVTLDSLIEQLRAIGITQKAFAAAIGMNRSIYRRSKPASVAIVTSTNWARLKWRACGFWNISRRRSGHNQLHGGVNDAVIH